MEEILQCEPVSNENYSPNKEYFPAILLQKMHRKMVLTRTKQPLSSVVLSCDATLFPVFRKKGGGQGAGRPGEKGAGGVREAGEEGAGSGIPKVAGSGRKKEKLCNIAQYFAIEKMQRGGSEKIQGGNRD